MTKEKPIWQNILGISSHLLTFVVVFLATVVIWRDSAVSAIVYLAIFACWYVTVFWAYCSKCTCHSRCTHVYMGWIASRIFRAKRTNGSSIDYLINTVSLVAVLVYPQFWLKDHLVILVVFWIVMIAMGPSITPIFCPKCENTSCPVHSFFLDRTELVILVCNTTGRP